MVDEIIFTPCGEGFGRFVAAVIGCLIVGGCYSQSAVKLGTDAGRDDAGMVQGDARIDIGTVTTDAGTYQGADDAQGATMSSP